MTLFRQLAGRSLQAEEVPRCLLRDNLTSLYFPCTSRSALYVVVTLCTIFVLTSFNRLNHTDLWGHVNFGRWIVEHGYLPAKDPFAASASELPILHSAWLAQVLAYGVHQAFGNEGLVFGHALLMTAIAGILMAAVIKRGTPVKWAWMAGAAMFVLDLPVAGTIRPQLFGQLGTALFLFACSDQNAKGRLHWWLPLVAALWANLHGSILVGLAILGINAVRATCTVFGGHGLYCWNAIKDAWVINAWMTVALALAGACVGPHGPLLLVETATFGDHAALASISEWRATPLLSLTGMLLLGSLGITALLIWGSPRKWQVSDVLLLVFFGLLAFGALRMLAWWAIVWPWIVIPHIGAILYRSQSEEGKQSVRLDEPTAMQTVLAMGMVFMAALISPPSYALVSGKPRGEGAITVTDTPLYVADDMARRGLCGTIAAPLDWADYLVWKTGGRVSPFVYSHVHLTNNETWTDYEALFRGEDRWGEILRTRQLKYVLASRRRHPDLVQKMTAESRRSGSSMRIVYQDERCLLTEIDQSRTSRPGDVR